MFAEILVSAFGRAVRMGCVAGLCAAAAACGQKGPLYLPTDAGSRAIEPRCRETVAARVAATTHSTQAAASTAPPRRDEQPISARPSAHRATRRLLHVEGVALQDLARAHGTPLFVYSKQWMLDALAAYQRGFAGRDALVCYAMKANSSLGVLRVFAEAGCGFDIVSGGELARVLAVGCGSGEDRSSPGVGKTRAEMRQALAAGIGCFNVESEAELDVLNAVALAAGRRAPISMRINPNVDPKTHPYISTGLKGNKFGVAHDRALHAYRHAASLPGLEVVGIDCHIGSQITEAGALPRSAGARARSGRGDRAQPASAAPSRLRRRAGHRLQQRHAARGRRAVAASCWRASTRAASATAGSSSSPVARWSATPACA